jgi:uncharacterized protein (DUF433 family)
VSIDGSDSNSTEANAVTNHAIHVFIVILFLRIKLVWVTVGSNRYTRRVAHFIFAHCKNYLTICFDEESHMYQLDRITQQPELMGGKACVRGLRVTVGMIVSQIGTGHSIDEVLADYPYLEREDILQALRYAAWRAEEREVELARA